MSSTGPGCELATTVLNCQRKVPSHLLMCRPHWSQVSYVNQQWVYSALETGGVTSLEYRAAVQAAVDDVLSRNGHEPQPQGPPEGS